MIKLKYPGFWTSDNITSFLLTPISWLYRLGGVIRKYMIKPIALPGYVICIGNVSVGGGGKTQIVKYLAKHLSADYKILIITKAYGSDLKQPKLVHDRDTAQEVGDESKLLAQYATVLATKSLASSLEIIKNFAPEVIIFDDGLQNPSFIKNFSIIAIDSDRGFGNGRIFPAGPLRQNLETAVKAADAIILSGQQTKISAQQLTHYGLPVFEAKVHANDLPSTQSEYLAFAGISTPENFFNLLKSYGIILKQTINFPDHHAYTEKDIDMLKQLAQQNELELITTEKDYVKLQHILDPHCFKVELTLTQEQSFDHLIRCKINKDDIFH